jgi:hypothetical protein
MGIQKQGKRPLVGWKNVAQCKDYVVEHGTIQFINAWRKWRDKDGDEFLWGDEVGILDQITHNR